MTLPVSLAWYCKVIIAIWLEDTRTLKQNTLAYLHVYRKVEHAYDTFRMAT